MIDLSHYQNIIEKELKDVSFPNEPSELYDPLQYFLHIGGKRMRPILTLMGCELFQTDYQNARHAAVAVELFHNFSLIHDDIMDEAPLRRGKETVHTKWNTNIAILSGDTLLIRAYQYLLNYSPELSVSLISLFNQTATQVCEGQQFDMNFETQQTVSIDAYLHMIGYKTAVLLGCSLEMGAIIGGASKKDRSELYEFGLNLGLAFQLQDDILDVYADQNKFGKQVGGDILANKKTYLLLKAFEDADTAQKETLTNLLTEKDPDIKISGVKKIYHDLHIKDKAIQKMNHFYDIAKQNLAAISVDTHKKEPLHLLSRFLMDREN